MNNMSFAALKKLNLTPLSKRVSVVLLLGAVALVAISGILYLWVLLTGFEKASWQYGAWNRFSVALESNIAAWYAGALWLTLAYALAFIGVIADRKRINWFLLSAVAVYAAIDEITVLHEYYFLLGDHIAKLLPFIPVSYTWVLIGIPLALLVLVLSLPLVKILPRGVRNGLFLAGGTFLLGAIVFETIGGHIEILHNYDITWHFMLEVHAEELLEFCGVIFAIAAVLQMAVVDRTATGFHLRFRGYAGAVPQTA